MSAYPIRPSDFIRARGKSFLAKMHLYIGANESRIHHWRAMAYVLKRNQRRKPNAH